MIEQLTVDQIYACPGFAGMVEEYAQITDPLLPPPSYRKEDYLPLEQAGKLDVVGVMDAGSIVGFAAILQGKMPHYGSEIAIVESIYVRRSHRKGGAGIRLIEAAEDMARIRGLSEIFINVHDEYLASLGILLIRRNYSARIHTFGRRL